MVTAFTWNQEHEAEEIPDSFHGISALCRDSIADTQLKYIADTQLKYIKYKSQRLNCPTCDKSWITQTVLMVGWISLLFGENKKAMYHYTNATIQVFGTH